MGQFNPFYRSNSGGGGGGSGSSEIVRYKIEKSSENSKTVFKLKQSINGVSSYVGDIITFDAADISFDSEKAQTVEEALNYLLNFTEGNYNFTTFQELGIDTSGKTMEQILSEVLSKNLPVNTVITGQIYKSAAPELGWNNAEAEIQITEGGAGQQIYWCSASSINTSPYQWNSIYYADDINSPINQTLDWTPIYYVHPNVSGTKTQYGEISVNDFTISISDAPFKFGNLANASQCGVPIENAKGEHSLCANSFTSTSECAESSSAFGYATKAGAKQQFVAGRYNAVDEGDIDRTDELYGIGQYVFILGKDRKSHV